MSSLGAESDLGTILTPFEVPLSPDLPAIEVTDTSVFEIEVPEETTEADRQAEIARFDRQYLRAIGLINSTFPGLLASIRERASKEDAAPHEKFLYEQIAGLNIGRMVVFSEGHPAEKLEFPQGEKNIAVRAKTRLSRGSGGILYSFANANFF